MSSSTATLFGMTPEEHDAKATELLGKAEKAAERNPGSPEPKLLIEMARIHADLARHTTPLVAPYS
jgi:hypothetical protein